MSDTNQQEPVLPPCQTDPCALIFDVDGVLADTETCIAQATIEMFKELYDVDLTPEDFRLFIGTGAVRYTEGPAQALGLAIDLERALAVRHDNFVRIINSGDSIASPGAIELLQTASSARWKIAIATSAPKDKFKQTMRAADIPLNYFQVIVTGDLVTHKKPHPEIYTKAAHLLGVPPNRCVVVEDAINGVQSAKAADMACIGYTSSFTHDQLSAADLTVDSLTQIDLPVLESLVS